ncbi:MAG: PAS domain-containing protein [Actinobacteria bacterium]|nr:PAS domain-containing protein [Actinomycetota bacterium]
MTGPDPRSPQRPRRGLWPYILAWSAAAVLGVGATVWVGGDAPAPAPSLLLLAVLTGLTILAESASTILRSRDASTGMSLSLLEFAVAIDLLLLPPTYAVAVIVASVFITHLLRTRALQKLVFNVAMHATGTAVAAAIMQLAGASEPLTTGRAVAALVAVLAFSVLNSAALTGLFARLGVPTLREQLTDRPLFVAATAFGSASVGIIAVALWTAYPQLTFVIVGPALALYLSYGSSFRMKALLAEVRTERDHLDRVVTGVQEGIVLLDDDGIVRLWNEAMTRITGVPQAQAIGQHASVLLAGTDEDGVPVDPAVVLQEGRDHSSSTVTLTATDGQRVETRIGHTLVHDERGRCIGDVVLVLDLSREREARSLKQDFVARVSHELRTPLTPLRGYAQVLLRAGDRISPEKRDEALQQMVQHVGHLERLIDDLLLVSRISSGASQPTDQISAQVCDLEEIVPRLVRWIVDDHGDREIRVVLGQGPYLAWADPLRVGQVVTNLLTNACKYTPSDTPIDVILTSTGEGLEIVVRDRGPGIPPDKLDAIFERFHRLEDPMRMRTSGLGLGLYIARSLAEAMSGALTVTSQRGAGATFTFSLPRVRAGVPAATGSGPRRSARESIPA